MAEKDIVSLSILHFSSSQTTIELFRKLFCFTCEWVESVDLVVAWPAFRSHYEKSPLFSVVEGAEGIGTCFNAAGKAAIATIQNSCARPTIGARTGLHARYINSF